MDIEDDLWFLVWESLKGSVRFSVALEALESSVEKYESCNVCIAGHSLGAGFALQVGKASTSKARSFCGDHLFNPPSESLATSMRSIGKKVGFVWKRFKSMIPSSIETQPNEEVERQNITTSGGRGKGGAEK